MRGEMPCLAQLLPSRQTDRQMDACRQRSWSVLQQRSSRPGRNGHPFVDTVPEAKVVFGPCRGQGVAGGGGRFSFLAVLKAG